MNNSRAKVTKICRQRLVTHKNVRRFDVSVQHMFRSTRTKRLQHVLEDDREHLPATWLYFVESAQSEIENVEHEAMIERGAEIC